MISITTATGETWTVTDTLGRRASTRDGCLISRVTGTQTIRMVQRGYRAEPWGYAPYHYGRWAFVGDRWYWVPDRTNVAPVYSPALVAFMPFGNDQIGWVPLGPGDVYVPHYYDASWQPYYLTRDNLYQRVVNLDVPGAVTVVTFDEFGRDFDWRRARKADRNMLASVNPVLDPLLLTPLRNAVVNSAWGRGKKDIPPGIARKLDDTDGDHEQGADRTAVPS